MPKHIIIWSEGKDSIEVYADEPTVVVKARREDLPELTKLDEAKLPGIYVLMKANKRYVGQASGGVVTRLLSHEKNKDWWSDLVFFAREDGRLDKSQLDYLEAKVIRLFKDADMEMDNGTEGNDSYIEPLHRSRANNTLATAREILLTSAHMDIFKKVRERKTSTLPAVHTPSDGMLIHSPGAPLKPQYSLTDSTGVNIVEKSRRAAFVKYMKLLTAHDDTYGLLLSGEKDLSFLKREDLIPKDKLHLYAHLRDDLYVYHIYSSQRFVQILAKVAVVMKRGITLAEIP